VTGGLRFILLGLVAAVALALSPGALGNGGQPIVVALSNGPNYVLNYQALDGVITHAVPAPPNIGSVASFRRRTAQSSSAMAPASG